MSISHSQHHKTSMTVEYDKKISCLDNLKVLKESYDMIQFLTKVPYEDIPPSFLNRFPQGEKIAKKFQPKKKASKSKLIRSTLGRMNFQHCWSPESEDDHLSCFERSDDYMLSVNKQNTVSLNPEIHPIKDKERQFDIQCCVPNLDANFTFNENQKNIKCNEMGNIGECYLYHSTISNIINNDFSIENKSVDIPNQNIFINENQNKLLLFIRAIEKKLPKLRSHLASFVHFQKNNNINSDPINYEIVSSLSRSSPSSSRHGYFYSLPPIDEKRPVNYECPQNTRRKRRRTFAFKVKPNCLIERIERYLSCDFGGKRGRLSKLKGGSCQSCQGQQEKGNEHRNKRKMDIIGRSSSSIKTGYYKPNDILDDIHDYRNNLMTKITYN